MKIFLATISLSCILGLAACSRSDDAASAKPPATPNPNLQKDAERLQQATANVAKEREKAGQMSPTPTGTARPPKDISILTVPPTSPNPEP